MTEGEITVGAWLSVNSAGKGGRQSMSGLGDLSLADAKTKDHLSTAKPKARHTEPGGR